MLVQLLLLSCVNSEPQSQAYQITSLNQSIGGPKALAQVGDFIIENDQIRVAILGNRPSMGPHTSGGSIIDADIQRHDPHYANGHGNDQLAEVFSTVNMNVALIDGEQGEVVILNNGADGDAVICATGPASPFISLLGGLWVFLNWGAELPYDIRTDYILEAGSSVLKIRTSVLFSDNDGCSEDISQAAQLRTTPAPDETDATLIQMALDKGMAVGDFYLQGGSLNVFTPGVGFDETGHIYELNKRAVNTFNEPIVVDYLAGVGDSVSYGIQNPDGPLFIPLFTASQTVGFGAAYASAGNTGDSNEVCIGNDSDGVERCFPPQISYERWFTVGKGDVGSVLSNFHETAATPTGTISGYVREEGTGVPLSGAHVFAYRCDNEICEEAPYIEWTTDVGIDSKPDGSFYGTLEPGDWELQVHRKGRPTSNRFPITITAGEDLEMVLGSPQPGLVRFEVVDEFALSSPAKISFFAYSDDGNTQLDVRNEMLGDGYISGNPAAVIFSHLGHGEVELSDGTYQAIASRGPEHELAYSQLFEVKANSITELNFTLVRSVNTDGWISADFHVHSSPSHDSGVSLRKRVITMVSEGVEYFTGTDHDYVTDFDPEIEALGLETFVNSAPGTESTTIEVGHYIGFPIRVNRLSDSGGAIDWTGLEPQEIIDSIRSLVGPSRIEPVVYVAHPRDGILGYFDQYNLDPYGTENDDVSIAGSSLSIFNDLLAKDNFSIDFDALEILNGKRFEIIRTPTQEELDEFQSLVNDTANGNLYQVSAEDLSEWSLDINTRTIVEQDELMSNPGTYTLGNGVFGQVDDWFTLLNLGHRPTALGNSDTHATTSVEAGCPRNYIMVEDDDPLVADDAEIAESVKAGRVVASYGPFIRFHVADNPAATIGSDIAHSGPLDLFIEVQSPSWFNVERVEMYENGVLINEFLVESPNTSIINFAETVTVTPEKDSWYVVIANGSDNLDPVFTTVEIPPLQLQDIVIEALSDVPGVGNNPIIGSLLTPMPPIPRAFPVRPFALTNPIWVNVDGDGMFTPPGLPEWMVAPESE